MAGPRVVVADDGNEVDIDHVMTGSVVSRVLVDEADDPFASNVKDISKVAGLSPAMRRKTTRTMEKVHRSADGTTGSKKIETENLYNDITGYHLFDVVLPPYNLDYLAKLNELSAPHYAAVKAKVANIVGLGFDFIETRKTKEVLDAIDSDEKTVKTRRRLARAKEELIEWLESCNSEDEFIETLSKVWTDYETTGNGYIEVGRTNTGMIKYIGHIPATTMRIRKQRDGFVQMIANRAVFFRNFGDTTTTNPVGGDSRPNEVIHIKKYSPTGNFYGVPDIIAARTAVAGNEFSSRFNLDYFENKAVPRYVIVMKGAKLGPSDKRQILEFFETNLKGKNHRTLFVPLPADSDQGKSEFKMEPVEAGQQDSSFNNYRKGNLGEILMAHRVPISKVGLAEGVSLAVARDADKTFKEQVCRPEQTILEKKLNKIIKEMTDVFALKLNELTLTDEDTLSKIDERYLRWGVIVPNEVRARWGWTGIEDGDQPVGMMQQLEVANDAKIQQTQMSIKSSEKMAEQAPNTPAAASGSTSAGTSRAASEQRSQANASRTRDARRSAASTDSAGEGRSTQGDGRTSG